ncbi:Glycerate kinase [compost metagenome]
METLVASTCGSLRWVSVTDALGRPVQAAYGRLGDGRTVVVELSSAAGLVQVPPEARDPLRTTTRGVGELIAAAWAEGPFERLILALGGSATVDAGVGLLQALGVRFRDAQGAELPPGGGSLARLAVISLAEAHPVLREARIELAVDVTNPLLGPRGAAPVYGPQKGATPEAVEALEQGLTRVALVLARQFGGQIHDMPGTGAAGGVPATLVAIAEASMRPGFELIAEAVGLDEALAQARLVVTGEGSLDAQSFEGKVVGRLAERCRVKGIPLVAIAGILTTEGEARLAEAGGAAMPLVAGPLSREEAMAQAPVLLEAAAARLARLIRGRPAASR